MGGDSAARARFGIQHQPLPRPLLHRDQPRCEELQIGEEISAGVPMMWEPEKNIKITLKSGNFGQKDFFSRALKKL